MKIKNIIFGVIAFIAATLLPEAVFAEDGISNANTAWILTSTALVLLMTLPGLAFFYGGLVRSKNVLSVLMQCFSLACLVSVMWVAFLYSLAFGDGGSMNSYIGGLDNAFLSGLTISSMSGDIPETVFIMFQLTFAIITPALIVGGFAERMKFSSMFLFSIHLDGPCLRSDMSYGMGWWIFRWNGTHGFCRRHSCPYQCRRCRISACCLLG
jgi:Amt family ammonium transporter